MKQVLKDATKNLLLVVLIASILAALYIRLFGYEECNHCHRRFNAVLEGEVAFEFEGMDPETHELVKESWHVCMGCNDTMDVQRVPEEEPTDSADLQNAT